MDHLEFDGHTSGGESAPGRYHAPFGRPWEYIPQPPREQDADARSHTIAADSADESEGASTDSDRWPVFRAPEEEPATAIYEAWEIEEVPTIWKETKSWGLVWPFRARVFCSYEVDREGSVAWNSQSFHDQNELKDLVQQAESRFVKKWKSRLAGQTYQDDLARRVARLPAQIGDELRVLLDDREIESNRTPYRRRKWNVVWMVRADRTVTAAQDQDLEPTKSSLLPWKRCKTDRRVCKLILKGQECSYNPQGHKGFRRNTNPWRELDDQEVKGRVVTKKPDRDAAI